MSKLYFRNTKNWTGVYAEQLCADGTAASCALTQTDADGDLVLDFDRARFESVRFCGTDPRGEAQQTGRVFPGGLSLGVEQKYNENKECDLTYLFAKQCRATGRVDTYVLEDERNLSYRQDARKKINVFLPSSYSGDTPHEVLCFFDAQNLFSDAGSYTEDGDPYGSWQLDVVLDALHRREGKNVIVVAVDNSDELRMSELFMEPKAFGKLSALAAELAGEHGVEGHLDELYGFVTETVLPFLGSKYSITQSGMGIGGSSMGGIAAFYCALKCPGTFSYCLSYSPAFGLYEMEAFESFFIQSDFVGKRELLPKIHIYCGEGDALEGQLVVSAREMKKTLVRCGYPEARIAETYDPSKPHNEESWRLVLGESFSFFRG